MKIIGEAFLRDEVKGGDIRTKLSEIFLKNIFGGDRFMKFIIGFFPIILFSILAGNVNKCRIEEEDEEDEEPVLVTSQSGEPDHAAEPAQPREPREF